MTILIVSFLAFVRLSRAENIFCATLGGTKLSGNACEQPILHGPTRYAFNKDTSSCQAFVPGCELNANNFESMNECQQSCGGVPQKAIDGGQKLSLYSVVPDVCKQPLDMGKCRGNLLKYGYDPIKGRCVQFTYGGCMGNDNNFDTKQECDNECDARSTNAELPEKSSLISVIPDDCFLPLESGLCVASITRYGYDHEIGRCVKFIYGGCMKNKNNYESRQECERRCGARSLSGASFICQLPLEGGPCNAYFEVYGYDAQKRECVKFIYGGCQGNENQFESKRHCENICKRKHSG